MSVELLIISPNQQVSDVKFTCDLQWSVRQLKDHLHLHHPIKPLTSQQRIIYSGRLLSDHHLLKDILTQGLDLYIVHLVCPQSTYFVPQETKQEPKAINAEAPSSVVPSSDDGLRQRFWTSQSNQTNYYAMYAQGSVSQGNTVPVPPTFTAYQLAAMQQTYAQVMSQFLANQAGYLNATVNPMSGVALTQSARDVSSSTNAPNLRENTHIPRVQENNIVDRPERDVLEWIYIISKSFLLCMILYFYSSPGKVMFVLSLAFLLFVLRSAGPRRAVQAANSATQNDNDVVDANTVTESNASDEERNPNDVERLTPRDLLVSITNFVTTFFTSLIPEQHVPIET